MCKWGTDAIVQLAHPMAHSGRTEVAVDACLAPLVQMLNDYGVHTVGCCCGHGRDGGNVLYEQAGQTCTLDVVAPAQPPLATPAALVALVLELQAAQHAANTLPDATTAAETFEAAYRRVGAAQYALLAWLQRAPLTNDGGGQ